MKIDKFSLKNMLTYLPIFILCIIKGFDFSMTNNVIIFIILASFFPCIFALFNTKYSVQEIVILLFSLIVGLVVLIIGRTPTFLLLILFLIIMKQNNVKKVLKLIFYTLLVCYFIMITLALLKGIDTTQLYTYRDGQYILRYSFGYSHPNYFHLLFFILSTLFLLIYNKKTNFFIIIILCILNTIIFKFSVSRTGVFVCYMTYFLAYFSKKSIKFRNIIKFVSPIVIIGLLPLSIILGIFYDIIPFISKLDIITTGRIQYIHQLLNYSLPALFGSQEFNSVVNFDNGYISLLYENGIIPTIIIYFLLIKTILYLEKENMYWELFSLFVVSIYGLTESFWPSVSINFTLYFVTFAIYENYYKRTFKYERNYYFYPNI